MKSALMYVITFMNWALTPLYHKMKSLVAIS